MLARQLEADRVQRTTEALRRGLLPDRLPQPAGLRLAARLVPAGLDRSCGSDWYDAIPLPDGTVGLTVGSVSGDGPGAGPCSAPGAAAAMGRVRAALRAYAVLEGEDPVSVLGDLELLLKTTEPARTATAVYAWVEPGERRITLAGAGHCPPVLVSRHGAEFVETSLSAPLGMLTCWEAPASSSPPSAGTPCCSTPRAWPAAAARPCTPARPTCAGPPPTPRATCGSTRTGSAPTCWPSAPSRRPDRPPTT